jgi:hypothetical protein
MADEKLVCARTAKPPAANDAKIPTERSQRLKLHGIIFMCGSSGVGRVQSYRTIATWQTSLAAQKTRFSAVFSGMPERD